MTGLFRYMKLAAVGLLLAFVTACSGDDDEDLAPCPIARVMGEPSEITRFRDGPGRDPTDILFQARFARVFGECSYDEDGGEIGVELTVALDVMKGQANRDDEAAFSYFIVVAERGPDIGPEPFVHGRQAFSVKVPFAETRKSLRYTDEFEITIPRPDNRSVYSYVLYLGFELTPAELEYNQEILGF